MCLRMGGVYGSSKRQRSIHAHSPERHPQRSFTATDVVAMFEDIIAETGIIPTYVRSDSGPEFTGRSADHLVRDRVCPYP